MIRIAIIGAGGNMGMRLCRSLQGDDSYDVRPVESAAGGRARLATLGLGAMEETEALEEADVAVMAVPDTVVGQIVEEVQRRLPDGAILMCLDPAAAHAGRIPRRDGVSLFVTHPTHPPLYDLLAEEDPAARRDFWGGGLARQSLVNALVHGPETDYARAEAVACRIFAPVLRSHRVTLEQMALLEPAMAETVAITCIAVMRETLDEVVARGVDHQAARDFMLGHIQIGVALLFDELDWKLSAGAQAAVDHARQRLFRDDWKGVLEPGDVLDSVRRISGG